MKIIEVLEEGRRPARTDKSWETQVTRKEYTTLKEDIQDGGMVAQKSFWTLMVRKMREEIGELPPQLHKAMMEPGARTSEKFGKRGDWKRRKVGLKLAKLRFRQYCFRGQAV